MKQRDSGNKSGSWVRAINSDSGGKQPRGTFADPADNNLSDNVVIAPTGLPSEIVVQGYSGTVPKSTIPAEPPGQSGSLANYQVMNR